MQYWLLKSEPDVWSIDQQKEFNNNFSKDEILNDIAFDNALEKIVEQNYMNSGLSKAKYKESKEAKDKAYETAKLVLIEDYFEE